MTHGDLFHPSVTQVRDAVLERAARHAEESQPGFSERAAAFIVGHLKEYRPTSGEQLTTFCKLAGILPHDDRAFGPVYMALAKRGLIMKVGSVRRERGNGTSGGNVWGLR